MAEHTEVLDAMAALDYPVVTAQDIAVVLGILESEAQQRLETLEDDAVVDSRRIGYDGEYRVWWTVDTEQAGSAADLDPVSVSEPDIYDTYSPN